ncbi:uncharacterized protein LOC114932830 [Nylanderia fulva]|uniref:uncharacterized protein LOC114932830 n=1 Tax=Nylanderia fulva TaxID=613905 RepID=UPI0010FB85B8|nr:uncharacterized protein LOC114932830 [Nylanderia fulva]XP_029161067.1 uncharacterized protein LOC114932830 [Nylanderia fulva]
MMNNPGRENNPPKKPRIVDAANPSEPYYNILEDIDISMVYNSEEEDVTSDLDIEEELNSSLTLTAYSDCEKEQQEEPLVIEPSIPSSSASSLGNLDKQNVEEDVMSDMDIEEELNSSSTLTASSDCEEEQQEKPLVIEPSIPESSIIFLDDLDVMQNVEVETSGNLDEPKNIDGPDHPWN